MKFIWLAIFGKKKVGDMSRHRLHTTKYEDLCQ